MVGFSTVFPGPSRSPLIDGTRAPPETDDDCDAAVTVITRLLCRVTRFVSNASRREPKTIFDKRYTYITRTSVRNRFVTSSSVGFRCFDRRSRHSCRVGATESREKFVEIRVCVCLFCLFVFVFFLSIRKVHANSGVGRLRFAAIYPARIFYRPRRAAREKNNSNEFRPLSDIDEKKEAGEAR